VNWRGMRSVPPVMGAARIVARGGVSFLICTTGIPSGKSKSMIKHSGTPSLPQPY